MTENKQINKDKKIKENSAKEKENFEHKYKLLLADMENLRKRIEKERIEIYKYGVANFLLEILPTVDMFEMALKANAPKEVKNWLIGFEMVLKNLRKSLETQGLSKINVNKGDLFDSTKHFAIEEKEVNNAKEGQILKVKTEGYNLHDRLLRPATVVVAKGKKEIKKIKKLKTEENENQKGDDK